RSMPVSAHVNNENNRALVVGVARSGTSWLGMALSRARNVRYYHEPDFIGAKRDGSPTLRADGFGAYPVIRPGDDHNPFNPVLDLATRPAIREAYLEPLGIRPPPADATELTRIAWHVGLLTHVIGDALARHPRWHLVTHEDLCVQPEAAFRGIFERLGLPWGPAVESFLDANNRPGEGLRPVRVTAEQPDRWRQRLSDAEVDEIKQVLDGFPRRGWVGEPA